MNITKEKAAANLGATVKEACAVVWFSYAAADVFDYPKAVAMGAEELAEWLRAPEV